MKKANLNGGDARSSIVSDMSLRHSFVDEDNMERMDSVESSSGDKVISRPSLTLKLGTELKSPSSSKNIKIIDQFEIKDNLTPKEESQPGYKPRGSIELRINP